MYSEPRRTGHRSPPGQIQIEIDELVGECMFGTIRQYAAVVLGVGAVLMMGAVPAHAASSQGAEVQYTEGCYYDGYGQTCSTHRQVVNTIQTPSGNTIEVVHARGTLTNDHQGGNWRGTEGSSQFQRLTKGTEAHQWTQRSKTTRTYNDGACTYEYYDHSANGKYRYKATPLCPLAN